MSEFNAAEWALRSQLVHSALFIHELWSSLPKDVSRTVNSVLAAKSPPGEVISLFPLGKPYEIDMKACIGAALRSMAPEVRDTFMSVCHIFAELYKATNATVTIQYSDEVTRSKVLGALVGIGMRLGVDFEELEDGSLRFSASIFPQVKYIACPEDEEWEVVTTSLTTDGSEDASLSEDSSPPIKDTSG